MILVDAGPVVALFDPADRDHRRYARLLALLREPLLTTSPVLTECFHLLAPGSFGAHNLRQFVRRGGVEVAFSNRDRLGRTFEVMERYADRGMDLADASLVALAEDLRVRRIFTVDRSDFVVYRLRWGRRWQSFEILSEG